MRMKSNPNDFYDTYAGKEKKGKPKDIYKRKIFGGLGLSGIVFMVISVAGIVLSMVFIRDNSAQLSFNLVFFGLQFLLGVFLMRAKTWAWWIALVSVSINILLTIIMSSLTVSGVKIPWLPILLLITLIYSKNEARKHPAPSDKQSA